jgi:hypothetical protein
MYLDQSSHRPGDIKWCGINMDIDVDQVIVVNFEGCLTLNVNNITLQQDEPKHKVTMTLMVM